jgi:hypothetical protein
MNILLSGAAAKHRRYNRLEEMLLQEMKHNKDDLDISRLSNRKIEIFS